MPILPASHLTQDAFNRDKACPLALAALTLRLTTTIDAEHAEPAEKTGFVLRFLRFLR
jgi:hypothetical protein